MASVTRYRRKVESCLSTTNAVKKVLKRNKHVMRCTDSVEQFYYRYLTSDVRWIKKHYKKHHNKELDLENPSEFGAKLQWLKLYWHDPLARKCADKYLVREVIKETIGEEYVNDLIGVYERVEDIDFASLPNKFVLKGTHGSGFNLICEDKSKFDWSYATTFMDRWLRTDYYLKNREWVYKGLKPRIICERYLSQANTDSALTDYKFYSFNGEVKYCQVIRDRGENETIDFYDLNWNKMPFNGLRKCPMSKEKHQKPINYEKMIELAEELSFNFPFVRVDFYNLDGRIIFGELTFFPSSGMGHFTPEEWNEKIGSLVELPSNE